MDGGSGVAVAVLVVLGVVAVAVEDSVHAVGDAVAAFSADAVGAAVPAVCC